MEYNITQAWVLLHKTRFNEETWNLDTGSKGGVEPKYECIKYFSESRMMKNTSDELHVGTDSVLQVIEDFS